MEIRGPFCHYAILADNTDDDINNKIFYGKWIAEFVVRAMSSDNRSVKSTDPIYLMCMVRPMPKLTLIARRMSHSPVVATTTKNSVVMGASSSLSSDDDEEDLGESEDEENVNRNIESEDIDMLLALAASDDGDEEDDDDDMTKSGGRTKKRKYSPDFNDNEHGQSRWNSYQGNGTFPEKTQKQRKIRDLSDEIRHKLVSRYVTSALSRYSAPNQPNVLSQSILSYLFKQDSFNPSSTSKVVSSLHRRLWQSNNNNNSIGGSNSLESQENIRYWHRNQPWSNHFVIPMLRAEYVHANHTATTELSDTIKIELFDLPVEVTAFLLENYLLNHTALNEWITKNNFRTTTPTAAYFQNSYDRRVSWVRNFLGGNSSQTLRILEQEASGVGIASNTENGDTSSIWNLSLDPSSVDEIGVQWILYLIRYNNVGSFSDVDELFNTTPDMSSSSSSSPSPSAMNTDTGDRDVTPNDPILSKKAALRDGRTGPSSLPQTLSEKRRHWLYRLGIPGIHVDWDAWQSWTTRHVEASTVSLGTNHAETTRKARIFIALRRIFFHALLAELSGMNFIQSDGKPSYSALESNGRLLIKLTASSDEIPITCLQNRVSCDDHHDGLDITREDMSSLLCMCQDGDPRLIYGQDMRHQSHNNTTDTTSPSDRLTSFIFTIPNSYHPPSIKDIYNYRMNVVKSCLMKQLKREPRHEKILGGGDDDIDMGGDYDDDDDNIYTTIASYMLDSCRWLESEWERCCLLSGDEDEDEEEEALDTHYKQSNVNITSGTVRCNMTFTHFQKSTTKGFYKQEKEIQSNKRRDLLKRGADRVANKWKEHAEAAMIHQSKPGESVGYRKPGMATLTVKMSIKDHFQPINKQNDILIKK